MIVRELFALLGFKVDEASEKKAEAAMNNMADLAATAAKALGVVVAAASAAVYEFADFAGAAKDAAESIGIGTDELQEFDYAAKLSGASTDKMRGALLALASAGSGVTERGKAIREMLGSVGVKSLDAAGKARPATEVFEDLVTKLSAIPDAGKRAAVATKVLGDSGVALLPLINKGPAGLAALREEAYALGQVFDGDVLDQGDELGDSIDRVKVVAVGLSRTLGAALAPAVQKGAEMFLAWRKENDAFIRTGIRDFAASLATALGAVVRAGVEIVTVAVNITNAFGGVVPVLLLVAAGFAVLNVAMLPAILTFAGVAAALTAIALVVEDVAMFEKYGDAADTLTGRLKQLFFDEAIKPDDSWIVVLLKMIARLAAEVATVIRGVAQAASGLVDATSIALGTAPEGLAERQRESFLRGRIQQLRQQGASDAAIAATLNIPEDQVANGGVPVERITPRLSPYDAAVAVGYSPAPPVLPPPALRSPANAGAFTDNRQIGPFYITAPDAPAAGEAVAERLRENNTLQVAE